MKQLKMMVLSLTAVAICAGSAPAQASVVTLVSTGTIQSGMDAMGIFGVAGRNLSGLQYSQSISVDLGPSYQQSGNSHYQNWTDQSTGSISGSTVVAGVSYQWSFNQAQVSMQLSKFQSDGFSNFPDQLYLGGFKNSNNPGQGLDFMIENSVYSDTRGFVSSLNPYQQLTPGTNGLTNLSLFTVQGGGSSSYFTASSNLSYVALNSVPEAESWAMLSLGMGALVFAARRRTKQKTAA